MNSRSAAHAGGGDTIFLLFLFLTKSDISFPWIFMGPTLISMSYPSVTVPSPSCSSIRECGESEGCGDWPERVNALGLDKEEERLCAAVVKAAAGVGNFVEELFDKDVSDVVLVTEFSPDLIASSCGCGDCIFNFGWAVFGGDFG